MTLADLDDLPADRAAPILQSCCGSSAWVREMVSRRPFAQIDALLDTADSVWWSLTREDWLEAFAHHPRLGEARAQSETTSLSRDWSADEQSRIADSTRDVRASLANANRAYEARFGFICIICATGKSADELLAITRDRLANTPTAELRMAAEEQRQITRLRLERLVGTPPAPVSA